MKGGAAVLLFVVGLLLAGREAAADGDLVLDLGQVRASGGGKMTTLLDMKTRYVVFQEYDYSCGAGVVATLLTYYFGEPVTEKQVILGIAEHADMKKVLRRRAFSLLDMKRFAEARGYKAVGYRMDFDFLAEQPEPVIVPITPRGYNHFVIFKGIVEDRVVIADPAFGNYTMRVARFLRLWEPQVGFVLQRERPRGPLTEEDRERQARFMPSRGVGQMVTRALTPSVTPIPGQVQSIVGPSPVGGSPLTFFNIDVSGATLP